MKSGAPAAVDGYPVGLVARNAGESLRLPSPGAVAYSVRFVPLPPTRTLS